MPGRSFSKFYCVFQDLFFPGQAPPGLSEADERWEESSLGLGRSCYKLLLLQWLDLDLKKEGGVVFVNISLVSWISDPGFSGFC